LAVGLIPNRHVHNSKSTFGIFQIEPKVIEQTRMVLMFVFQISKT
jgi:hypothetical protein